MNKMEEPQITKGKRRMYYAAKPAYKYALFAGESFYPAGGFKDFYGYAMTYAEALEMHKEALSVNANPRASWWGHEPGIEERGPCDWCHIVNLKKQKIVYK
jgi:hypothetical protein